MDRPTLRVVPDRLLALSGGARRGVIVLGADGLAHRVASAAWPAAELDTLVGTVPTTSATAWLTALTGAGPQVHGVAGTVYRVPADGSLIHAITGAVLATGRPDDGRTDGAVVATPTVFQRWPGRCVAIGREIATLRGPWAAALLAGARRVAPDQAALPAQAADPALLADAVVSDVDSVLTGDADLVWVYVNLDDHVHRHGYDDRALTCLAALESAALRWVAAGWTVVAHADHGQVPVDPDPALDRALHQALAGIGATTLPPGGAGRIRWFYPAPGRADQVAERVAGALGASATVLRAGDLCGLGMGPLDGVLPGRVGEVVAVAESPRFPLPDLTMRYEHGALDEDELLVPFAVWR